MPKTQTESIDQREQPSGLEEEARPSPMPLPREMTPLEVVQDYIAAIRSGTLDQKLADEYILKFQNYPCQNYRHEGFEEAAFVSPDNAKILKVSLKRDLMRQRKLEEIRMRARAAAPSLHLRAESDDEEESAGRRSPQLVTPPQPVTNQELEMLKFVESRGVLKQGSEGSWNFGDQLGVNLTLGYRQVPLASGNGNKVEIFLATYHRVASSPMRILVLEEPPAQEQTRARVEEVPQPSTSGDPPAQEQTRARVEEVAQPSTGDPLAQEQNQARVEEVAQPSTSGDPPVQEQTQARVEAVAQPSASGDPPAHRYFLRKRRQISEVGKVGPKRRRKPF